MSLFQARDWWSTNCGSDETFDIGCMVVDNFSQEGNPKSQHIVVGSHQGYVRMYLPGGAGTGSGGSTEDDAALSHVFCPDDLLLETRLDSPVLSLLSGQFITGSSETCLLVLMPHMVSVFTLNSSTSAVQHGSQHSLSPAYSHRLKRSAFNVFSGRFGGVSNKEQFCVQSLDGILSVFGRENLTFSCFLPDILLPGPVLYSSRTDSIVTSSSNWTIDSYKYASLARGSEAADKTGAEDHGSGVRMYPDWSFNYGEPAQDLQHMSLPGGDAVIVVLGERSLMFLKDIGTMYMYNHLDYMPSCMINFTNDGGELMTAVCSHSASVYVYAAVPGTGGVLRWTARLSLVPRCVLRVQLHGLRGLLALLSDAGALQAVYMGSTPALTVAPPIDTGGLDYDQLEEELAQLNDIIDKSETTRQSGLLGPSGGGESTDHAGADVKLLLQVHPVLDPCHLETQMDEQVPCASVRVLMTPCADTVRSVRLHLLVDAPLVVSEPSTTLEKLDRTAGVEAVVYMERCGPVPSLQLRAVASYITASGAPRVVQTSARLPLALVVRSADPVKEAEHKVTIVCSRPAAHLSQLFSDLGMEAHMSSAAAVRFYGARIEPDTGVDIDGATVTLLVSRSSQRYRLQSDQLHAIWLIADELILRLNLLYNVRQSCSYAASLPLSGFIAAVDDHLLCRQRRQRLLERLEQLAGQLRAVQRRLLTRYRDLSPAPLANLEQLLEDSYRQLVAQAHQVESADTALQLSADQLSCCTRLLQLLVRLSGPQQPEEEGTAAADRRERSLQILECAITHCCTEVGSDEQGWEERVDAAVSFLYKFLRADPNVAISIPSAPPIDASSIPTDSGKLKRHVGQLLDKMVKGGAIIADTYDERLPVVSAAGPAVSTAAVSAARPVSARFVQRPTSSRQRPASGSGSGTVRSRRPVTQLSATELEGLSEPVASNTVTDSRGDGQLEAASAPSLLQSAEADATSMTPAVGVGSFAASSTSCVSLAAAGTIESALQPLDDDDQPSEEFW